MMSRPLLRRFPNLTLPWLALGNFPTPVQHLERLGAECGLAQLWIKRDDQTSPAYGGNKVRKLEFLLADAQSRGASTVLTLGATGSSHVIATAFYAKRFGLRTVAVLVDQPNATYVRRHLQLGAHWGATQIRCPHPALLPFPLLAEWLHEPFSYFIPTGGSSPVGTIGYVSAAFELADQIATGQLPLPAAIFVAAGTTGTQAGLMLGLALAGLDVPVIGIRVCDRSLANERRVERLFQQTRRFMIRSGGDLPTLRPSVSLIHDHIGEGYARFTPEANAMLRAADELENIPLEGTYTAKALCGATAEIRRRGLQDKPVLFWHTANGAELSEELLLAKSAVVPSAFRSFFEAPLQVLDPG